MGESTTAFARFLGTFYGVLPFKLSECAVNLKAKVEPSIGNHLSHISGIRPSKASSKEEKDAVKLFNKSVDNSRKKLSLVSGMGSDVLGGTSPSPSPNETSFRGILQRYFEEILPECVHQHVTDGFSFESFLSPNDYKMALQTAGDATKVIRQTSSLKGLMDNLENRGHAPAPFVEGLTVELLPFQLQSLQWMIERETIPGGIQSYFWTKLPSVAQPNTDVYYNPILGRLKTENPNLVRGGILAEQMGLGKTVECCA